MSASYNIDRDVLISALETCASVTSKKQVGSITAHARLRMNHVLEFSATNAVVSVRGKRSLTDGGALTEFGVGPTSLLEAARRMPTGAISLRFDDGILTAKSGKRSLKIATVPADQLPPPVDMPETRLLSVPSATIRDAVTRVQFAVLDEKRQTDGVRLWIRNGRIDAQVLTGYHGVIASAEIETKAELAILIPPGLVEMLVAAASEGQDMRIGTEAGSLYIQTDGETYRYQSYVQNSPIAEILSRAFSQTGPSSKVKTAPLLESLRYAQMAAGREAPRVALKHTDGAIQVTAHDGQRDVSDAVESADGDDWEAAFNPTYLIPALDKAGEEATITIADRSMLVRAPGYEACVMGVN